MGTEIAVQVRDLLKGGVIQQAVNFFSFTADVYDQVRPAMDLAERLGRFLGQVCSGTPERIEVGLYGEFREMDVKPLLPAAVAAILKTHVPQGLTIVNACAVAKERGIQVVESTSSSPIAFANLVALRLKTSESEVSVAGTVFGRNHPRLVDVDGVEVDVIPQGHMLLVKNEDTPGIIGHVGTLLGDRAINIARMNVGRKPGSGRAVMLIEVDGEVPGGRAGRRSWRSPACVTRAPFTSDRLAPWPPPASRRRDRRIELAKGGAPVALPGEEGPYPPARRHEVDLGQDVAGVGARQLLPDLQRATQMRALPWTIAQVAERDGEVDAGDRDVAARGGALGRQRHPGFVRGQRAPVVLGRLRVSLAADHDRAHPLLAKRPILERRLVAGRLGEQASMALGRGAKADQGGGPVAHLGLREARRIVRGRQVRLELGPAGIGGGQRGGHRDRAARKGQGGGGIGLRARDLPQAGRQRPLPLEVEGALRGEPFPHREGLAVVRVGGRLIAQVGRARATKYLGQALVRFGQVAGHFVVAPAPPRPAGRGTRQRAAPGACGARWRRPASRCCREARR